MSQFSTTHYRYVLGVLFIFLFPATVAAIPINQYPLNLNYAIATLEDLSQTEEFDNKLEH